MQVQTTRFGEQEVDDGKVIQMPEGMLGFAEKRFILLTPPKLGPFCWFQAVDNPDLAFIVVDATRCVPDHTFALTREEARVLELDERSDLLFLLVVTMAPNPRDITVNLRGPIALNPDRMVARQIVFEGEKFATRHPFFHS
jgi:flagellar assembly factor FliW